MKKKTYCDVQLMRCPAGDWNNRREGQRREMAVKAVASRGIRIALACRTFSISESCYRYEHQLSAENAEIAEWLVKLTSNRRTWVFGLCFLYLCNVKGFGWNHKRVYRIYCELELNRNRCPVPTLRLTLQSAIPSFLIIGRIFIVEHSTELRAESGLTAAIFSMPKGPRLRLKHGRAKRQTR